VRHPLAEWAIYHRPGTTTYTYDATNRLTSIKDARGLVYLMNQYDANDRVVTQLLPDGSSYQFAYSVDGQGNKVTTVTNPRGYVSTTTFNSSGYPTTEVEAVGTRWRGPPRRRGIRSVVCRRRSSTA
jgi:YD repeat-containing protein